LEIASVDFPRTVALSILIASVGRLESLRELLACLAACKAGDIYEVVVIDNGYVPPLTPAALATPGIPALRILNEPLKGKSYALNRALDEGGLGEIIAVIDDDMSPSTDWLEGVLFATRRLPQFDIFSGRSHVIWPTGIAIPPWAREPLAHGCLFSVIDFGPSGDVEFGDGIIRYPSGNHFWFRRSLLDNGSRFPHVWLTEPYFVTRLVAQGHRGIFVPEAVIGHRVQTELIDVRQLWERARRTGQETAELDLSLSVHSRRSRLNRIRSALRPLRALAEFGVWSVAWLLAGLRSEKTHHSARTRALIGIEYARARFKLSLGKFR
jgi:glycosyltransferase involved in cell wall biosynthesis